MAAAVVLLATGAALAALAANAWRPRRSSLALLPSWLVAMVAVELPLHLIVEWIVVKARVDQRPDLYRRLSPIHQVREDAPPFFVVHGTADTLVAFAESRDVVGAPRARSSAPVLHAEMRGGQHAFDALPSVRTARVVRAIERFLAATYATHRAGGDAQRAAAQELVAR